MLTEVQRNHFCFGFLKKTSLFALINLGNDLVGDVKTI